MLSAEVFRAYPRSQQHPVRSVPPVFDLLEQAWALTLAQRKAAPDAVAVLFMLRVDGMSEGVHPHAFLGGAGSVKQYPCRHLFRGEPPAVRFVRRWHHLRLSVDLKFAFCRRVVAAGHKAKGKKEKDMRVSLTCT